MPLPPPDWIEVAYALPERQWVRRIAFREGITAVEAVRESGLIRELRGEDADPLTLGIYGRPVAHDHIVGRGDRVEIYRRLRLDPREARRRLAAEGRTMGPRRRS